MKSFSSSVLFLIASMAFASASFADTTSYSSLLKKFNSASPAIEKDLTGVFVGDCYMRPKSSDSSLKSETFAMLLLGGRYFGKFQAGMLTAINFSDYVPETTPGSNEDYLTRIYRATKDLTLGDLVSRYDSVKNPHPISGSLISNFTYDHDETGGYAAFRKDADGLIATSVITDLKGTVAQLGVVCVCHGFKQIDKSIY